MTAIEALQALRQRWWILLAAAALAAVVAFAYTKMPWTEQRWRSSVLIQATGRLDYGNFLALEKELRPLAEQVRQLSVMREVNTNLHTDIPPEVMLDRTRAEPVQDSGQIRLDIEDADPRRAEQVSLEIANVYTSQHNAAEQGKLREERVILSTLDRQQSRRRSSGRRRGCWSPAAGLLGVAGRWAGRARRGVSGRFDSLRGGRAGIPAACRCSALGHVAAAAAPARSQPARRPSSRHRYGITMLRRITSRL